MTHRLLSIGPWRIDVASVVLWAVGAASALVLLSAYVDALHASIQHGESLRQLQSFEARQLAVVRPYLQSVSAEDADAPAP